PASPGSVRRPAGDGCPAGRGAVDGDDRRLRGGRRGGRHARPRRPRDLRGAAPSLTAPGEWSTPAGRLGAVAILGSVAQLLVLVLWLLVLGRLLLSWVDPAGRSAVAAFLTRTTEPILAPVGRALPRTGSIDWSG